MFTIQSMVLIAHVLISASIIGLVLLQRGKGADAGAAFGSGSSGTVFGARGSANFLSRATGILAAAFFLTSLTLAFLGSRQAPGVSQMNDTAPV
jgi:preprotein translocase subunit SecG